MCRICEDEKKDEFHDKVHHMIHRLIPILSSEKNDIGLCAMIDLLVMNCECDKTTLMNIISDAYDFFEKFVEDDEE